MENHDKPGVLRASVWQRCGAHWESIDWEWSTMTKKEIGFYQPKHGPHCCWLAGEWGWNRARSVLRQSWGHTGDSPELEGICAWTSKIYHGRHSERDGGEWSGTGNRLGQRPHWGGSPSSPHSVLDPASSEVNHKSDNLTSAYTLRWPPVHSEQTSNCLEWPPKALCNLLGCDSGGNWGFSGIREAHRLNFSSPPQSLSPRHPHPLQLLSSPLCLSFHRLSKYQGLGGGAGFWASQGRGPHDLSRGMVRGNLMCVYSSSLAFNVGGIDECSNQKQAN